VDTNLRAALQDLLGLPARWIVAGLIGFDVAVLMMIVIADGRIDEQQLSFVGVGLLVFGGLALAAAVLLGDLAHVLWLRFTGPGYRDMERQRRAEHLARRALLLCGVCVVLVLIGPPLVLTIGGSSPVDKLRLPVATPTPTISPARLG